MKRNFNNFIERGIQYEKEKNEKIEMMRKQKEKDAIKGISFRPQRISRNIHFTGNHMSFIEREKIFLEEKEKKINHRKNSVLYKEEQIKNKKLNQRRRSVDIEIKCNELYNRRKEHENKITEIIKRLNNEQSKECTFTPKINKSNSTVYLKRRKNKLMTEHQISFEYINNN